MNHELAIVIPAYKVDFLKSALNSIANQTSKDFIVYIGDDCSPYDLKSIVKEYINVFPLVYKRFDNNMGGKNLVSQWNRCLEMTQGEKWLWLFSDDDIMGPKCVELFYSQLKSFPIYDVYHFDVKVIDDNNNITSIPNSYPDVISSYDYYSGKMQGRFLSLVVENIFSREIWEETGGFENFDLAWGSDTASWTKFMHRTGMKTIHGDNVLWRCSNQNISPNTSEDMVVRKLNALNDFYKWSISFFNNKGFKFRLLNLYTYFRRIRSFRKYVSQNEVKRSNHQFCMNHNLLVIEPILNLLTKEQ